MFVADCKTLRFLRKQSGDNLDYKNVPKRLRQEKRNSFHYHKIFSKKKCITLLRFGWFVVHEFYIKPLNKICTDYNVYILLSKEHFTIRCIDHSFFFIVHTCAEQKKNYIMFSVILSCIFWRLWFKVPWSANISTIIFSSKSVLMQNKDAC